MIVEFGHFALILALLVATVQVVVPAFGASLRDDRMMRVAEPAAVSQLFLIAIAFFALMYAYVTSDFSVANVAANSHSTKPLIYKMAGVWGNHEGSMLLWVLILALFGAAVALFGNNLPPTLKARVLSVQASIAVAFLAFLAADVEPVRASRFRRRPMATVSIRSCRTRRSPSIRRFSTPAMSASRSPFRSRSRR